MSLLQKTNLYDCLCAALRKPISEGGHLALTAALNNRPATDIAVVVDLLSDDEALAIFNWLDNRRAEEMLHVLKPERIDYILRHAPAGRVGNLSPQ
jgi:Mg/Co/Ni transporter MgtE